MTSMGAAYITRKLITSKLLPFSCSRTALLQRQQRPARPSNAELGWDFAEVMSSGWEAEAGSRDLYGSMERFLSLVQSCDVEIRLSRLDACEVARRLKKSGNDLHTISTSNICDANYVGFESVLRDFGSLLWKNGTLVSSSMNWIFPNMRMEGLTSTSVSQACWSLGMSREKANKMIVEDLSERAQKETGPSRGTVTSGSRLENPATL
ncbi:hypothetical protein SELMODRAFT_415072 [Selaginella moellendorffii]|uniref:Uncharacterized protein n=1 Tax=Selaginella moellendorffii TaxID=88036 RepID=D8RUX6_SELML|nr:hypothetical protein SELMODRAFT_415072 [Selaginella moellendorffii]